LLVCGLLIDYNKKYSQQTMLRRFLTTTTSHHHNQQRKLVLSTSTSPLKRFYSTTTAPSFKYKTGDNVHGWTVQKVEHVSSFHVNTYQLTHDKTGAKYFHVEAPSDKNNSFSISFQTPPDDSTGAPHILEHTTLCGSEKYPVQDLFFNMYKRSMNTYMNAYTAPDHTTYPFATQNENDYYNLMSVYLDATLFPRLLETDFRQEGHRLEFDQPHDKSTPLRIKGVVYNEMKGAMSDPAQFFWRKSQAAILPGTIYAFNSGGDPTHIPDITYEQLKKFHQTHYHPSHAYIFTYGDLPFEKHLRFMNENGFERFEPLPQLHTIDRVKPFSSPQRVYLHGPPDSMATDPKKQTKVAVSFLTNDCADSRETFAMSFLCGLLLDDPRGPFYKNIIEKGIAPDFAPGTGYSSSHRDATFTIGFQGIKEKNVEMVEQAIEETFEQVARNGIPDSLIQTALHSLELSVKKKSPNFGVELCYPIVSNWIHSQDPANILHINEQVSDLKKRIADPNFLKSLVTKYFIGNPHKVTVVMNPDEKHTEKQKQYEQERIQKIEQTMTEADKDKIIEDTIKMEQTKVDLEKNKTCLPSITITDIPRIIVDPVNVQRVSTLPIHTSREVTNGIVYCSVQVPLSLNAIPQDLHPLLPVFGGALTKMGARDMDSDKLIEQTELYTGGIHASFSLVPSLTDTTQVIPVMKIGSLCLERNVEKMVDLIHAIITEPKLDSNPAFLKSLIDQSAMEFQSTVVQSGHTFAKRAAAASLTQYDNWDDKISGLQGLNFLNNLANTDDLSGIADQLQELTKHLLVKKDMKILYTSDPETSSKLVKVFESFHQSIPESSQSTVLNNHSSAFPPQGKNTYVKLPTAVSFVAQSLLTAPFASMDSIHLRIASHLINSLHLHQEIREKGGAYGSSASESMNGTFSFTSYRDPNAVRTIKIFSNVADWVENKQFTELELQEAKLQVFQALDAPSSPHSRAASLFTYGITDELRQQRRDAIFATTAEDIKRVCNKYLRQELRSNAILGDENEIPEEIVNSNNWILQ
jgi:Zn-dependent M16 (insulinase) family peptidase